jgi:hypothetical protein
MDNASWALELCSQAVEEEIAMLKKERARQLERIAAGQRIRRNKFGSPLCQGGGGLGNNLNLIDKDAQTLDLRLKAVEGKVEELREGSNGTDNSAGKRKSEKEEGMKRKAPTIPGPMTRSRVAKP